MPTQDSEPVYFCSFSPDNATWSKRLLQHKLDQLKDLYAYLLGRLRVNDPVLPEVIRTHPEDLSDRAIEDAAMALRGAWGMKDGPIPNLTGWAERKGFVIAPFSMSKGYCTVSQWTGGRGFILLKEDDSATQQRRSLAHALGHMVLHRAAPPASPDLTDDERRRLMETQAHHFAAAFLFPEVAFRDEVRFIDPSSLRDLSRRWGMSSAWIVARAAKLEIVDDPWSRLRTRAREDTTALPERPRLLRRCFSALIEDGGYTPEGILRDLGLPELGVAQLAGLPRGFLGGDFEAGGEVVQLRERAER